MPMSITTALRLACLAEPEAAAELLELAWGIIANAGHGDWTTESPDWQDAACKWRDAYHAVIGARQILAAPSLVRPAQIPSRAD